MPPILAFVVGALTLEIIKFGVWLAAKPGWKPGEYTRLQLGHFVTLIGGGGLFCVAWSMNGLDVVASWLPQKLTEMWGSSGIPYTPQVGLWFGVAMAFQGVNKIADAFRERTAAAVQPVEGGTGS